MGNCCCCTTARELVSKKKIRYIVSDEQAAKQGLKHGVNLDLVVLHRKIICMGYPAVGLESTYRNRYDDVLEFLDTQYGESYKVYNLCSEEAHQYGLTERFHGRVASFPFPDGTPPPLGLIPRFVCDATAFLQGGPDRVVAIHCKAGKGRTGLMACCLLMAIEPTIQSARDAIDFYDKQRAKDCRGLTHRSQVRYVEYYGELLASCGGVVPTAIPQLRLDSVVLHHQGSVLAVNFITVQVGGLGRPSDGVVQQSRHCDSDNRCGQTSFHVAESHVA